LGVTVGVAVLIMVMSVMEGFEIDLRRQILGNQAHVLLLAYGGPLDEPSSVAAKVAETPGVVAVAPFTYTEVMLRSRYGVSGAILKGIDPVRSVEVNDMANDLQAGPNGDGVSRDEALVLIRDLHTPPPAVAQDVDDTELLPGIILGSGLAESLNVYPGAKLHVINPIGAGTGPMGIPMPTTRAYRVAATVHTGMYEYDTKWSYITLGDAQEFMGLGDASTGLEVRVEEDMIWDAPTLARKVEQKAGPPWGSSRT
jgi:lipoprotein-releasing system permease protein